MASAEARRKKRFRRGEEGQASFEFLLILPIFFIFILLAVDFGMWMYQWVTISNDVRDTVRYGSVTCQGNPDNCDASDLRDWAINRSSILTGGLEDTFEIGWKDPDGGGTFNRRGDSVLVKITHDYSFLFFPFALPVTSCAEMRIEADNDDLDVTEIQAEC